MFSLPCSGNTPRFIIWKGDISPRNDSWAEMCIKHQKTIDIDLITLKIVVSWSRRRRRRRRRLKGKPSYPERLQSRLSWTF